MSLPRSPRATSFIVPSPPTATTSAGGGVRDVRAKAISDPCPGRSVRKTSQSKPRSFKSCCSLGHSRRRAPSRLAGFTIATVPAAGFFPMASIVFFGFSAINKAFCYCITLLVFLLIEILRVREKSARKIVSPFFSFSIFAVKSHCTQSYSFYPFLALAFSFPLIAAQSFYPLERCLAFALFVIKVTLIGTVCARPFQGCMNHFRLPTFIGFKSEWNFLDSKSSKCRLGSYSFKLYFC